MKKLLLIMPILALLVSCSKYDDTMLWNKVNDHESRIQKLESLCQQLQTNVDALQTIVNALQNEDYVTNVAPIVKGGETIGYTITFKKSGPITILNGQDGEDGKDGDTYVPVIGVRQDADGNYYWTIDGEWMLDSKGNRIRANGIDGKDGENGKDGADGKDGQDGINGTNGQDGQNGSNGKDGENGADGKDGQDGIDGKDGKDGITPKFKIEDNYWYVSYDNGTTWEKLGKATGSNGLDGINGSDGQDGDSIFSGVSQDESFVYFTLSDGSMITLPKATAYEDKIIHFEDLRVKRICVLNWDLDDDGELSYDEAAKVIKIDKKSGFSGRTDIISFDELKYFSSLAVIGTDSFKECSELWKITLPESLKEIGNQAFYNCKSLTNMVIPKNVETIGEDAFKYCVFNNLYMKAKLDEGHASSPFEQTEIKFIHVYYDVPSGLFKKVKYTNIVFHNNIELVESFAFSYYYTAFKGEPVELHLPESIRRISDFAFSSIPLLDKLVIGENIEYIGKSAFQGNSTYYNDKKIDIYIKSLTPPFLGEHAFDSYDTSHVVYTPFYKNIYVPMEVVNAYKESIYWNKMASYIKGYNFED